MEGMTCCCCYISYWLPVENDMGPKLQNSFVTSYKNLCPHTYVRFSAAVHFNMSASVRVLTSIQYVCAWASCVIHSLEFGPDILLISSSWICLTSREMCCSRSLFCSSSWWTRAWASSRAVASALSWSFNRWTCTRGGESRGTDRWGERRRIGTDAQCSVYKHFPLVNTHKSSTTRPYLLGVGGWKKSKIVCIDSFP